MKLEFLVFFNKNYLFLLFKHNVRALTYLNYKINKWCEKNEKPQEL